MTTLDLEPNVDASSNMTRTFLATYRQDRSVGGRPLALASTLGGAASVAEDESCMAIFAGGFFDRDEFVLKNLPHTHKLFLRKFVCVGVVDKPVGVGALEAQGRVDERLFNVARRVDVKVADGTPDGVGRGAVRPEVGRREALSERFDPGAAEFLGESAVFLEMLEMFLVTFLLEARGGVIYRNVLSRSRRGRQTGRGEAVTDGVGREALRRINR